MPNRAEEIKTDKNTPFFFLRKYLYNTGKIIPIYNLTYNLSQNTLRKIMENGIKEADITFMPAKSFSPYMECLPVNINEIELKRSRTIEVNPNYRYEEIFGRLLSADNQGVLEELQMMYSILG